MDFRRGLLPAYCCYWLPLRLRLASTTMTCLYDLLLRLASMACFYGLPLQPASMVCLHHVIAIIIIIIVHLLFKRNIYLSLLYVIYVFFLLHFLKLFVHFFF